MCFVAYSFGETKASKKITSYRKTGIPTWGLIELTNTCNFSCAWCYAGCQNKSRTPKIMSRDMAFEIADRLIGWGIKQITLSGGEPTIVPYLLDLIKHSSSNGVITNIISNTYLIDEDFARRLRESGLYQIETNLDSIRPDIHDEVRGVAGAHAQAMNAIKILSSTGIKVVAQMVVTKDNQDEVSSVFKLARELGASRFRVSNPIGYPELAPDDFYGFLDQLTEEMIAEGATEIQSYDPKWSFETTDSVTGHHLPCCAASGAGIPIDVDGNVMFCQIRDRTPLYSLLDKNSSRYHLEAIKDINLVCE